MRSTASTTTTTQPARVQEKTLKKFTLHHQHHCLPPGWLAGCYQHHCSTPQHSTPLKFNFSSPHMGFSDQKQFHSREKGVPEMYGTEKSLPVYFKWEPKKLCHFFHHFFNPEIKTLNCFLGTSKFQAT